MIQQPNFNSKDDECRKLLINLVKKLKDLDPEFVLKVGLCFIIFSIVFCPHNYGISSEDYCGTYNKHLNVENPTR